MGVVLEVHTGLLQIAHHGKDHGLVLVVAGETQGAEVGQPAHMVDEAGDVALHLQGAMPVLEGEHGAPIEPEIAVQNLVREILGDLFVLKLLFGGEEELHDLHAALVGQVELVVGMGVLAAILGGAAERVVGVALVEPVVVVEHAHILVFKRGDVAEEIPHDLEVVVHLATAAHGVAQLRIVPAVAGAAGPGVALQNMDVLARHLAVAHQKARCR